jgi:hypothetical protein
MRVVLFMPKALECFANEAVTAYLRLAYRNPFCVGVDHKNWRLIFPRKDGQG